MPKPDYSPVLPVTAPLEEQLCSQLPPIDRELCKLPVGEAYHNVPEDMRVGDKQIIQAGIAPKITPDLRREIPGEPTVKRGVKFDPQGVDMQLLVNPDEFKVFKVKGGKQFVTAKIPGEWIWEVTPLKPGKSLIVVQATVDLKVPQLNVSRPITVEVFSDTREVEVNWTYSISEFVSKNWKEVLSLIIGSGSLAGATVWWIGKQEQKKKAKEDLQAKEETTKK
ncbi:MAG: hypothetical protein KME17_30085 [Cyanosarcina radialis HA8281-LM2]|nr:hypothetical protein [Cyanosarcina radialis HA8281-LM2]